MHYIRVPPYDARIIANYFLELGSRDRIPLDPLKIQKLVYLAHGWHLAFFGRPLILQSVEAWRYGPVVQSLYSEFRDFRACPITRPAYAAENTATLDAQTKSFLENVWQTYRQYSPVQLSMITHEPGYAWDLTMRNSQAWGSPVIPNDVIADEFRRRKQQG
jgi:uncharacterized phage-associated protein